jgi:hypothetical protein
MFQCIIQQRNGWIHVPNQEFRDVFPGNFCCLTPESTQQCRLDNAKGLIQRETQYAGRILVSCKHQTFSNVASANKTQSAPSAFN